MTLKTYNVVFKKEEGRETVEVKADDYNMDVGNVFHVFSNGTDCNDFVVIARFSADIVAYVLEAVSVEEPDQPQRKEVTITNVGMDCIFKGGSKPHTSAVDEFYTLFYVDTAGVEGTQRVGHTAYWSLIKLLTIAGNVVGTKCVEVTDVKGTYLTASEKPTESKTKVIITHMDIERDALEDFYYYRVHYLEDYVEKYIFVSKENYDSLEPHVSVWKVTRGDGTTYFTGA